MSRRPWIVAAQVVAVVVLVVVVYVTLLRPDSGSPLRGVEAPGDGNGTTHAGGGGDGGPGGNGRGGDGDGGPGGSGGAGAGSGVAGRAAGAAGSLPGGLPGANGPGSSITPPGDQYADAVSALLTKVGGSDTQTRASIEAVGVGHRGRTGLRRRR